MLPIRSSAILFSLILAASVLATGCPGPESNPNPIPDAATVPGDASADGLSDAPSDGSHSGDAASFVDPRHPGKNIQFSFLDPQGARTPSIGPVSSSSLLVDPQRQNFLFSMYQPYYTVQFSDQASDLSESAAVAFSLCPFSALGGSVAACPQLRSTAALTVPTRVNAESDATGTRPEDRVMMTSTVRIEDRTTFVLWTESSLGADQNYAFGIDYDALVTGVRAAQRADVRNARMDTFSFRTVRGDRTAVDSLPYLSTTLMVDGLRLNIHSLVNIGSVIRVFFGERTQVCARLASDSLEASCFDVAHSPASAPTELPTGWILWSNGIAHIEASSGVRALYLSRSSLDGMHPALFEALRARGGSLRINPSTSLYTELGQPLHFTGADGLISVAPAPAR